MTIRAWILALSLLSLLTSPLDAQSFLDWSGLQPGPHAVGFRAVPTTDATRSYLTPTDYRGRPRPDFGNRPVQVSIWYPAQEASGAAAMTYGDYVNLLAWETGPVETGAEARKLARDRFQQMSGRPVTAEGRVAFEKLYEAKVRAIWDAKPAPGRFPVLISAPGQGYPAFDNSVMAEFLASHGFVVIASPSMGPDGRDMPDSPLAIDAESRDLEYLAGYVQSLPQADGDRIATIGFSLGGSASALFALRNARVKALVSLDGVLRDDRYLTTLKSFPQFVPARLRAPLLWIACGPESSLPGFGEGSFPEEARHAEVVKAVSPGLHHHDFSSMSSLQRRRAEDPTKDWTSATASYEAASRLLLAFLQSRLQGLNRRLDAAPEAVCKVTIRPAKKAPPMPADVREAARAEGIPVATELVRTVRRDFPDVLPDFEEPLVLMAYETLGGGDGKGAIALFTLTVELFPRSIDGSYGLGKALMAEGSFVEAEPHFLAARSKLVDDPNVPAEQKAGALGRIDTIIEEIRAEVSEEAVKRLAVASILLAAGLIASASSAAGGELPVQAQLVPGADSRTFVVVKGQKLFYRISGSGPNLLLLHGGLSSSEDFDKIVPVLSKSFRVVTVDRSGHGCSTDSGEPFVYATMAEEQKAFLDAVGISSTAVLGWSDGGVIGYHLASRYPGLVTRLVAIGANARVDGMAAETVAWIRSRSTPESLLADLPDVAAAYRRLSPKPDNLMSFLWRSRDLWLRDPYITPGELGRIEAPVLLVAGDRNDIRIEHLLELRAALKNARLCVLPDASHFVLHDKPHLLLPIVIDFLAPGVATNAAVVSEGPSLRKTASRARNPVAVPCAVGCTRAKAEVAFPLAGDSVRTAHALTGVHQRCASGRSVRSR